MTTRRWLTGILVVAFALRLWLVCGGGQYFWADESRYDSAAIAAGDLAHGEAGAALKELFGHADHVLFRPAALPVAILANAIGGTHPTLIAAYFSLFSLGTIFMVWAVAKRSGAPDPEALWATFLAAAANSLFIYARFYLPYDVALFELMVGLWLALGRGTPSNSLLTGVVCGCGFLTYNGYWLLAGTILVLHTCLGAGGARRAGQRGLFAAAGLILAVVVVLGAGASVSHGLMSAYGNFAASVKQGDFNLGYRVIAEYLWTGEGCVVLVWMAALAYAVLKGGAAALRGRLGWWAGGLVIVLGGLVFFSDVVPKFMVYGRLTRAAVPFACLAAAQGIALFLGTRRAPKPWSAGLAIAVAALAAWNFSTPLVQVFPGDFIARVAAMKPPVVSDGFRFYRVLFADPLYGKPLQISLAPHTDVLRVPNPLQYRPYQFEGYTAAARAQMNRSDFSMRLVRFDTRLAGPDASLGGYPGPVKLTVTFHPGEGTGSEPLVVTGVHGEADIVLIRYLDESHVQFGLDHWGHALLLSRPLEIDFGKPHDLVISAGSLLPPDGSPFYGKVPWAKALTTRFVVIMDGSVACSLETDFYSSVPGRITFGTNLIGSSTTGTSFSGTVSEFLPASLDQVASAVPSIAMAQIAFHRAAEWDGALGPLRLGFRLPPEGPGSFAAQPILAIGGPDSTDLLYVAREGKNGFKVFYDSRGGAPIASGPIALSADGQAQLDICLGSMLPGERAPIYARFPGFMKNRSEVYVAVNGRPVLVSERPFPKVAASWFALGENTVACSSCGAFFQGEMESMRPIGPENLLPFGSRLSDLLENPDPRWQGFIGPLKLRIRFPVGMAGREEPILVSGSDGMSDAISVLYDDDSHIRFRFAQSKGVQEVSEAVAIIPGTIQELLVSTGALMPPEDSLVYKSDPELLRLREFTEVGLNGRPVLFVPVESLAAGKDQVEIGASRIGGALEGKQFHGKIESLLPGDQTAPLSLGSLGADFGRLGWDGFPGPLIMSVVLPENMGALGLPLVTTGYPGGGDFIVLRRDSDNQVRVVQDHWGSKLVVSDPFSMIPGVEHRVSISFGALYPPVGSPLYSRFPEFLKARMRTVVSVDGKVVLAADQASHPTAPDRIVVGANLIGGSTAAPIFTGTISNVEFAPPDSAVR